MSGLDLGSLLSDRLGRTVRVENDVNAAALGTFSLLGRTAADSMAYLNLGTGLAAGLALGLVASSAGLPWLKAFAIGVEPVGTIWMNMVRMCVLPLVVTAFLASELAAFVLMAVLDATGDHTSP